LDIPGALAPRPICAPIPLVLHGDLLDPWCWIVERRVITAAEELHPRFAALEHAPLPPRLDARAPTAAERRRRIRELTRAASEPDAPPLSAALWSEGGPAPLGSVPALVAVAAARMQGPQAERALREALREAALVSALDISRRDVIVEVAARAGLDLARFVPALEAPGTERALRQDIAEARDRGIATTPALVVGDDWLVSGARSLREYRIVLKRYLADRAGSPVEHTVH
jgi:predicted DsbA family dithiol-disulfide isomerase